MCGISGFFLQKNSKEDLSRKLINQRVLHHRGPDAFKTWSNFDNTVGLQHYRLSILDLSDAGSQPMISVNKRFVIVFNGEIYNHKELRRKLETVRGRHQWRGHSDTETLIECIAEWGLERTLSTAVGMFSIGLFDQKTGLLQLARDRFGEKPLYYGFLNNDFYFASEIKALKRMNSNLDINPRSVTQYLKLGYISGESSIYKNIYKLKPGCILSIRCVDERPVLESIANFWDSAKLGLEDQSINKILSDGEVVDRLNGLLSNAVIDQMGSDVPVGVLLSGGVDSSLITSIVQRHASKPINTFTIGFSDFDFDEAPSAKKVASFLGTSHNEIYFNHNDLISAVKNMSTIYCEPFADTSLLPTILLMSAASNSLKVVLSGDGGDEVFAGYTRYRLANRIGRLNSYIAALPHFLAQRINRFSQTHFLKHFAPFGMVATKPRLGKLLRMLSANTLDGVYNEYISIMDPSLFMAVGFDDHRYQNIVLPSAQSNIERLMLFDMLTYLPDNIFTKSDRASMAASVECRSPFLDHNVVKFAWSLSIGQKMTHGREKGVLRELLKTYIPSDLFDRPKQGFGIPMDTWLRGPLKKWSQQMVYESSIVEANLFEIKKVQYFYEQHQSGQADNGYMLWVILAFFSWYHHQVFLNGV